jgi:Domain of unknown function (DUF932)
METIDWEIIEKPIYANNQPISGYKGIFRNDNGTLLNIAKSSYTPTRNEKFIEVCEKLQTITGFPLQNYYTVEDGRKVLAFLECTEPIQVCGFDFKDYLMIGNSFDGSTGFFIGNSSIMVRCSNRFSKNFRQLQVNHTKNNSLRIDNLVQYFDSFMLQRRQLFNKMEQFASVKIDDSIRKSLIERLTRMNEEEKLGNDISTRKSNIISQINYSIDRECADLGNNAFGLFNGITHYTTHIKSSKSATFGNPFGSLNELNQTAYKFCNELV